MSDKDFDRIFSKGLDGAQKHPYDDQDWEKLAERLDEHDNKIVAPNNSVTTNSPLWKQYSWLGLLLLLLIGSNAALFFKINQAENRNNTLIKEVNNLRNEIEKSSNTNTEKNIIQKDTVIIYKYLPSTLSQNEKVKFIPTDESLKKISSFVNPSISNTLIGNNLENTNESIHTLTTTIKPLENQQIIKNTSFTEGGNQLLNRNGQDNILDKNIASTAHFDILLPLISDIKITPLSSLSTKKGLTYLGDFSKIVKPTQANKKLYLGMNGGIINYHTSWLNRDNIEIYRNEKSYQAGLKLEYAINNNWRIIAGSDYCPFNLKIYWQDARYNLPEMPAYFANNPTEYKLKSSEASQQLLQGYIGVKHLFSNSRWRPYVGVSYSTMRILPFETTYTFTKLSNNKDITPTPIKQNQVTVSNIGLLTGGFEYRLNNRFLTQAEAFYNKDLNKTKKTYDLFGARLSVLFGF